MSILARIPKSITFLLGMTILTGVLYPAAVTLVAQLAFPAKANGSLATVGGRVRGSLLLAQKFESPRYFHPRPSATDYAYVGAGASNLGPVSADLAKAVQARREAWIAGFGTPKDGSAAPEEMLYASASGLDPEIGTEAALAQVGAIVAARGLGVGGEEALVALVKDEAKARTSLIGPPRVNVLDLNLILDARPVFNAQNKEG